MDSSYHRDRATAFFARYLKVQTRIEQIEKDAHAAGRGSPKLVDHLLKHDTGDVADEYRRLCGNRDMFMRIAQLSATMAVMFDTAYKV